AFLAGFRVVCCLFYRFPVRNALRASQAVHATDVMVNGVADSSIKKMSQYYLYDLKGLNNYKDDISLCSI
ncbi:hypothetical protein QUD67_26760, partial [Klebsiella pneumoniae]